MPYGFGGGFAAGFDSGIGHGREIGETRLKREALQQEQIKENVALMQGYINDGLKNLSETVSKQGQRTPQLEAVIQNYQSTLTDAAKLMSRLGPQGEQAAQMALQSINNIIPNLQTQSEAFSAKREGEVAGAFDAANKFASGTMMPSATPGPIEQAQQNQAQAQPSLTDASSVPTAADPTTPTQVGSGTNVAQNVAQKMGYSEKELFEMMLTGKPPDKAADDEKIGKESAARFAAIDQGIQSLEEKDPETGIKYRELLSKPSTWSPAQAMGLPGKYAGTELQLAKGAMAQALQGALYALTGAQINVSEDDRIYGIYFPSYLNDDDKSAAEKIKRFYAFIGQAKKNAKTLKLDENPMPVREALIMAGMDPKDANEDATRYNQQSGDTQVAQPAESVGSPATAADAPSFASEEEAAAAGLPDGAKVIINGVRGTWRN